MSFQGMDSDEGNSFFICCKRYRHFSEFSCISSVCDSDKIACRSIKEAFLCSLVNSSRELLRNPSEREAKMEMFRVLDFSPIPCFPEPSHDSSSNNTFASYRSTVPNPWV